MADLPFIDLEPISGLEKVTTFDPGSFLYAGEDGILKRIDAEKFYQLLNNIAKPLSPSDTTPTREGWYKPQKSSDLDKPSDPNSTADWGTKYPNAGNLRAKSGYDTLFNLEGNVWKKTEVKIDYKERFLSNYIYNRSKELISDIILDNGSGNFTIDSSGLKINTAGPIGSGVILNKQINLNERFLELRLKLNPDQVFYVGTRNVENVVGENTAEIDCSAKTLKINDVSGMKGATKNFTMPIISGRDYLVRLYKKNEITKLELIDTVSTESDSIEVVQLGQFDKYKFGLISGAAPLVISSIRIVSMLTGRAFIGFYGDSITEGNSVGNSNNIPYYKNRFANLIGDYIGRPYYVSGRSAGTIDGVLARMQTEIPILLPRYVFVTIGTNGGNTEAKLNQLVDFCESYGCIVILNLIPLYDSSTAAKNAMIQTVVNARKLLSVKMNVATSVNNDGVTKDDSLFANESGVLIHPNAAGNIKIFNRVFVDTPELFQESGVISKTPEVPMTDINNMKKVLRSFIEPKYTLDYTFYLNDPSHYTIYGVNYWFGRRLKANNLAEGKTAPKEYYNVWQNINTIQGGKKISKLILNIIPYTNISTDVVKNVNLLGIKGSVITPLIIGNNETVPTALQKFEISVEEYDSISIGLYNLDASTITKEQTIEFYTVDKAIVDDGVRKAIEINSGGTGAGPKEGFIDLIDYGCIGDGIADDTNRINSAIVELISKGGGTLYGRRNKFKVSSIDIPDVKNWLKIEFLGDAMPVPRFGTIGTFDVTNVNGMEILSNLSNINRGVINVLPGTAYANFNMVLLSVKNCSIRTYNNPNCYGIAAHNAVQLNLENVVVDTLTYNVQSSKPSYESCGILTPKRSNGAFTYLRNVSVSGYKYGISVHEHTDADQIILSSCEIGLWFRAADHASYFKRVCAQRNTYHVGVDGSHIFEIAQLNMEFAGAGQTDANNSWQNTINELQDPSNLGRGSIKYANVKGGIGLVDTFRINGGANVIVKKVGSETRLTGSGIS